MKNVYFNRWEFLNALSLIETDPYETKTRLENYISEYPNDYSAHIYYSYSLIRIGKFKEAENIIEITEKKASEDTLFLANQSNVNVFNNYLISARIKILSFQERYEELYEYCLKHINEIKNLDLNRTFFYSKKKIGKIDLNRREKNSYIFRQIVEYKESDFLEHIKKHLFEYNIDIENPNACIFSSDFPLNKILEEIKKNIPSEKRIFPGDNDNLYTFKYDSCGKVDNKNTDYFNVVCFHNTKEIITMYPSLNCEKLPCIDLNHLNSTLNSNKVKRLNRIEKFNQRYNR